MKMPDPDQDIIARRLEIAAALRAIVPGEGVIVEENERRPYESDGLTAYRQLPMIVVLPETTQQVSDVLRYCHANGVKVVPRGAGTSLSGGALPLEDGILLGMAKFNRILDVDLDNRCAVVQPGVTNLAISTAVSDDDFYYAPDPSSQIACYHRRQCGGELRRCALPEIRADHQQPAGAGGGAGQRRDHPPGRQASWMPEAYDLLGLIDRVGRDCWAW